MKPKKLQKKLIFNKSTVANLSNAEQRRILGGDATPDYICPGTNATCNQTTCQTCFPQCAISTMGPGCDTFSTPPTCM